MKKCLAVIMLAVFILSACSGGGEERDLSTPSSRLVGHWRSINTVAMSEYYFGEIDEETGKGAFAEYGAKSGTLAKGTYKVVRETPEGEAITIIMILFGYEDSDVPFDIMNPETDLEVQEDGMKAKMRKYYIEYVDDKTEYEPEK